ncbi:hypothetical protein M6B38_131000 [Iris pallida]|uniref:Uncharacterized protein n=1 Tax=Iris pallida TaxID=29817 RepID=A0AAX6G0D5_IRIPA|nr:hypothetical protein M6B38_131000 [Iris pallida]
MCYFPCLCCGKRRSLLPSNTPGKKRLVEPDGTAATTRRHPFSTAEQPLAPSLPRPGTSEQRAPSLPRPGTSEQRLRRVCLPLSSPSNSEGSLSVPSAPPASAASRRVSFRGHPHFRLCH